MGIFSKLMGVKVEEAEKAVHGLAARIDAEGYSEAVIREMEDEHLKACTALGKAKTALDKESKEAEAARDSYNKQLAAAQAMKADIDAGKTELQPAYDKLVGSLQQRKLAVQTEIAEAEAAQAEFDAIQNEVNEVEEALRNARSQMSMAKANAKLAETQARTAERKAAAAGRSTKSGSRLSALTQGLEAINTNAASDKAKAEAMERQANLYGNDDVTQDADIAAYMNAGKPAGPSLDDLSL